METGLATVVCATIDLILFLADPVGMCVCPMLLAMNDKRDAIYRHLVFNFPLAKLYTNSLLSSLNARKALEALGSTGSKESAGGLIVAKRASAPVRLAGSRYSSGSGTFLQPPPHFRNSGVYIDVESITRVSEGDVSMAPMREAV
jgi:hypothetical protein